MAFRPIYILILGFTIVVDYFAGILIEQSQTNRRKKIFLVCSIFANVGVLAFFKYYNFLNANFSLILESSGHNNPLPMLSILLPIGLSFHTFQAMSYTIEVYRGNQKAERSFGIYALYVMFYPQLVAGPIERPQNLLPQFRISHNFDYEAVTSGLRLIGWGLFKKVVIADRLGLLVDSVYDQHQSQNGVAFAIATLFFSFQIFCDFSGYSDIAIGTARIMGFKLMKNFDKPYHSKTISEFWSRWHISLSTWFRDYLYIPLGGNRVSAPRWYLNLFIVFLVSGLWHGANWTFVLWGAIHGVYLVFGFMTQSFRARIGKALILTGSNAIQVISTFGLVSFAWIFFRASNLAIALHIIRQIGYDALSLSKWIASVKTLPSHVHIPIYDLIVDLALICFLETVHFLQGRYNLTQLLKRQPIFVRWAVYGFGILAIFILSPFGSRQFIYFQF